MRKMRWSAYVGFASICPLLLAWASPAFSQPAGPCRSGNLVSEDALRVALSRRSIDILRLAEEGNEEGLRPFVPPSAKFNLGEHDVIMEIGDGPKGAMAFAKRLGVSDFQFTMMDSGPPPPVSGCSDEQVSLLLMSPDAKQAYQATFQFKGGQLTEAWVHDINLYTGKIEPN
jgi:hypothetical protein